MTITIAASRTPGDQQEPAPRRIRAEALAALPPDEQELFARFGIGPHATPRSARIHDAILDHAARHPDAVAIEHLGERLTYAQLDHASRVLSAQLRARGVAPGDRVGLFLERSIEMVVGILGILRTGAAYVPQHVGVAPVPHLRHVVRVAGIDVILTLPRLRAELEAAALGSVLEIDARPAGDGLDRLDVLDRQRGRQAEACFVIFTSGTTGTPNGVLVTHRNVCNVLLTSPGDLGIRPGTRVAQILSISFDMAAWEILGCLANGGTLVIRGSDIQEAVAGADVVIATPSILGALDAEACAGVQVVAVAGESCPKPLADVWSRNAVFVNSCGPTEVTIVNTIRRYDPAAGELTIGTPVPNSTVYVLDADLRPCRIGEVGEMWAGGDCVSSGYLGDEELTRARYLPDPFLGGDAVMFRTRDLARWTAAGELVHLGRLDDQVKVRGFRVELDSISTMLEGRPGCAQAVTLKLDHRTLAAFVRPAGVDLEAARAELRERLPYYCEPALIVALDVLPITSRGKLDRTALTATAARMLARLGDGEHDVVLAPGGAR